MGENGIFFKATGRYEAVHKDQIERQWSRWPLLVLASREHLRSHLVSAARSLNCRWLLPSPSSSYTSTRTAAGRPGDGLPPAHRPVRRLPKHRRRGFTRPRCTSSQRRTWIWCWTTFAPTSSLTVATWMWSPWRTESSPSNSKVSPFFLLIFFWLGSGGCFSSLFVVYGQEGYTFCPWILDLLIEKKNYSSI